MLKKNNSETKKWYAVYTRYKCEKSVNQQLEEMGVESYLPLYEKVKRYASRVKRYQVPLINCYVFVNIDLKNRVKILELPNVHSFIKFGSKITPIPEEEIEILRRLTMENIEIESHTIEYRRGEQVEIFAGPLIGLKGKVLNQQNKNTFILDLNGIGYAFQFKVNANVLRKI